MKALKLFAAMACGVLLMGCASSGSNSGTSISPQTVSIAEYRDFLNDLNRAVDEGIPRELSEREKVQYSSLSNSMQRLLANHETIDSIPYEDRQRIFNTHERIQALIMGDDSGQVICRSERSTGTNFRRTSCMTRSDWVRQQEEVERYFQNGFGFGSEMTGPEGG